MAIKLRASHRCAARSGRKHTDNPSGAYEQAAPQSQERVDAPPGAQTGLTTDDLIWPLFLVDGSNIRVPVPSMPGVERLSVDQAVRDAERGAKLAIPCIALFPYTDSSLRDELAARRSTPTISFAARSARSRKRCRKSASCATLPSIPTPARA